MTGKLIEANGGPMLGRPTATSIRIWVRTAVPMPFRVVYSKQLPLSDDAVGVEGKTKQCALCERARAAHCL